MPPRTWGPWGLCRNPGGLSQAGLGLPLGPRQTRHSWPSGSSGSVHVEGSVWRAGGDAGLTGRSADTPSVRGHPRPVPPETGGRARPTGSGLAAALTPCCAFGSVAGTPPLLAGLPLLSWVGSVLTTAEEPPSLGPAGTAGRQGPGLGAPQRMWASGPRAGEPHGGRGASGPPAWEPHRGPPSLAPAPGSRPPGRCCPQAQRWRPLRCPVSSARSCSRPPGRPVSHACLPHTTPPACGRAPPVLALGSGRPPRGHRAVCWVLGRVPSNSPSPPSPLQLRTPSPWPGCHHLIAQR